MGVVFLSKVICLDQYLNLWTALMMSRIPEIFVDVVRELETICSNEWMFGTRRIRVENRSKGRERISFIVYVLDCEISCEITEQMIRLSSDGKRDVEFTVSGFGREEILRIILNIKLYRHKLLLEGTRIGSDEWFDLKSELVKNDYSVEDNSGDTVFRGTDEVSFYANIRNRYQFVIKLEVGWKVSRGYKFSVDGISHSGTWERYEKFCSNVLDKIAIRFKERGVGIEDDVSLFDDEMPAVAVSRPALVEETGSKIQGNAKQWLNDLESAIRSKFSNCQKIRITEPNVSSFHVDLAIGDVTLVLVLQCENAWRLVFSCIGQQHVRLSTSTLDDKFRDSVVSLLDVYVSSSSLSFNSVLFRLLTIIADNPGSLQPGVLSVVNEFRDILSKRI